MKIKLLSLLVVLASLVGYLEWSGGNAMFIGQMELLFFDKLFTSPEDLAHPFIILPFAGQLLLIAVFLLKRPAFRLAWAGVLLLSVIMLMILLIGAMGLNWRMLLSAMPFFILAVMLMRALRQGAKNALQS
jgi:hypothetical protein